ncbi:cytochrome ubiquinol oxidase subunit I [Noviherbaspirillum massiliense]|uniref:cytochrome ubiquinol oxidase subunit I n=1 Tax=Noviherbaspirillum massiliense TaxID=1465823 RepID=UPI0002DCD95E|nr:cytochrome ubiquinol oxidase subunit I [Noviherbaspirillum massiliense]
MDALLLSRLQFAWVIAFHILLPAFTVGLACYVATLEVRWWITKNDTVRRLSAYWIKIFAISFGMGVVSGIVMPFQFGTNWSRYSDGASPVIGSLIAYEVVTAFFLEAAFLGVLLFGRKLVPQWAHALSAILVALGTLLSSFWILATNSWMQTPRGYEIVDGRFMPTSMFEVIFTPSFPYRLTHTVIAFLVTTAFVILGVGAFYLRHKRFPEESKIMMRMSLAFLGIMVPLQILVGDLHGLNSLEHQPTKVAAMEGLWETGRGVPASLFAIPDQEAEKNHFEIAIPKLASIYLTHDINGEVKGLKEWPKEDRPPVAIVYFAFRIMVGIGLLMLATVYTGLFLWKKGRLFERQWYLRLCMLVSPVGFIAVLAGWTTTEVGRQPWVVYGLMRTRDAVTPSLTTTDVAISLLGYMVTYAIIFGAGFILLRRLVRIGPPVGAEVEAHEVQAHPKRPLSAVTEHDDTVDTPVVRGLGGRHDA